MNARLSWIPNTSAQGVPQPAGQQCADWYIQEQPDAEDLLYALAHQKGRADALEAALEELLVQIREDVPESRATRHLWDAVKSARAALGEAQQ